MFPLSIVFGLKFCIYSIWKPIMGIVSSLVVREIKIVISLEASIFVENKTSYLSFHIYRIKDYKNLLSEFWYNICRIRNICCHVLWPVYQHLLMMHCCDTSPPWAYFQATDLKCEKVNPAAFRCSKYKRNWQGRWNSANHLLLWSKFCFIWKKCWVFGKERNQDT